MSIRLVMKDEDKLEEQLREIILEKIPQMEISISCPYAQYVEFGSDPATNTSGAAKVYDYVCGDWVTEPNLRIRKWAQDRLGLSNEDRKRTGDRIYHSIMDNGMIPRPFIRPAIHKVLGMMESGSIFDMFDPKKSISENVCQIMKDEMLRILAERGYSTDAPMPSGKLLMNSIEVRPLYNSSIRKSQAEKNTIPESVWKSDTSDRHGVDRRKKG